MRILVTGATGFVGRWLGEELREAGHEVVATPAARDLDITDREAVARLVSAAVPDAIAHLAGVSFAGDARRDPALAMRVNVGGTVAIMDAAAAVRPAPVVLVTGSSEVYGVPRPADLPLSESAPLGTATPYGLSKLAQEAVAVELGLERGVPVVVSRSFNQIGPGQRTEFVVPAVAERIASVVAGRATSVRIGNADVRRDFLDVRDAARAYRLLIEWARQRSLTDRPIIVNIASGASRSIRSVVDEMKAHAGCSAPLEVDDALVRPGDAPEIAGSHGLLTGLCGWRPEIPVERTLREIMDEALAAQGAPR